MNMNPHALRLYLWVIALTAFGGAKAQSVPPLMNYQGNLTNATGQPLPTGQYTLTFNDYNVPTGGAAVWGPQAITADVVDGYFNVVLSTDSTGGDSITTAFTAQPRYVSIRVNTAAEILPRQQVLSAPYAIQAGNAATASVASTTSGTENVFPGTGSVGIGTTTPDRKLSVVGNSRFSGNVEVTGIVNAAAANVSESLTVGSIQFSAQKVCRLGSNSYRDTLFVPSSWTIANCRDLGSQIGEGGTVYAIGCVFGDGTASGVAAVALNQPVPLPSPNCGW